jgi:hypothetical protein
VLFVGVDDPVDAGLFARHLARARLFFEAAALGRVDVDEDLRPVAQVLVQLVEVALVPLAHELARVLDGHGLRVVERVAHLGADRRVAEGGRLRREEPLLFAQHPQHVVAVLEQRAVAQGVVEHRLDVAAHLRLAVLEVAEELERLLLLPLAPELRERRRQLALHRLVLLLEARHDARRRLVLAGREVDLRPQDVGLGVEAVREVGRLDRVDVAQRVRVVARHEVGPALFEEPVEPVLAGDVDLVPVVDGERQLLGVDARRALRVGADGGRVVGARHRQERQVAQARRVFGALALGPVVDRLDDALERLDRRRRLPQLHVADAAEELRRQVVARAPVDPLEQGDALFVGAVLVLVAPEQVVEVPVQLALVGVVEARDLLRRVLADALDDVGRLGQLRRQRRQPEQRLVEAQVVRLQRDLGEDAVRGLVELQIKERDGEVVLRDLLVALVVVGLAPVDPVERDRRLAVLRGVEEPLRRLRLLGHLPGLHRARVFRGLVELDLLGLARRRRRPRRRRGGRGRRGRRLFGRRRGRRLLLVVLARRAPAAGRRPRLREDVRGPEGRDQRQHRRHHAHACQANSHRRSSLSATDHCALFLMVAAGRRPGPALRPKTHLAAAAATPRTGAGEAIPNNRAKGRPMVGSRRARCQERSHAFSPAPRPARAAH